VQALWIGQLDAGITLANRLGDTVSGQRWLAQRERLLGAFLRHFIQDGVVADHLNPDGSRDVKVRPNQLFTAPSFPPRSGAEWSEQSWRS